MFITNTVFSCYTRGDFNLIQMSHCIDRNRGDRIWIQDQEKLYTFYF